MTIIERKDVKANQRNTGAETGRRGEEVTSAA
jgi:hypothetical protein